MTRNEFYSIIHPLIEEELDEYRGNGGKAVDDALTVCFLKELDFRLSLDDDANVEDDEPWLDEVDPKWFVDEVNSVVDDWDRAPEMLCCEDTGFEAYLDFMNIMKQNWEEHKKSQAQREAEETVPELELCPKCGKPAKLVHPAYDGGAYAHCTSCSYGPQIKTWAPTDAESAKKWNKHVKGIREGTDDYEKW